MLRFFKLFSMSRTAWCLLLLSALSLEFTALFFQYGMDLKPCVLCIYERVAMVGLIFASIIGMLNPNTLWLRLPAIAVGLISAVWGGIISLRHVDLQMNPAPWKQCEFLPNFPDALPLHQWFPLLFNPTGTCDNSQWSFLGISMVQWLVIIFAVYATLLIFIFISQFSRTQKHRRLFQS